MQLLEEALKPAIPKNIKVNEADRRRQLGSQKAMLYAPRMQDGSEVLEPSRNGHLEERVEKLNSEIARVRAQLERLGTVD